MLATPIRCYLNTCIANSETERLKNPSFKQYTEIFSEGVVSEVILFTTILNK